MLTHSQSLQLNILGVYWSINCFISTRYTCIKLVCPALQWPERCPTWKLNILEVWYIQMSGRRCTEATQHKLAINRMIGYSYPASAVHMLGVSLSKTQWAVHASVCMNGREWQIVKHFVLLMLKRWNCDFFCFFCNKKTFYSLLPFSLYTAQPLSLKSHNM